MDEVQPVNEAQPVNEIRPMNEVQPVDEAQPVNEIQPVDFSTKMTNSLVVLIHKRFQNVFVGYHLCCHGKDEYHPQHY